MSNDTRRTARVVPHVLAALLAGLLTTAAWLWWDDQTELDQGPATVARQQAINFFSLHHRHIDRDLDRVLALSTGTFKEQYASEQDRVRKGVVKQKLVISAKVPDGATATEYQREDLAKVLVAVDATTTSKGEQETNRYRVRVSLQRIDDRWLVAGINQVG